MGILKTLFIIVLVSIIGGNVARIQLTHTIAVTLLDLTVAMYVTTWLLWKIYTKQPLQQYVLFKPILTFIGVAAISLVVNSFWLEEKVFTASLYLIRWVLYAGVYMAIQDFSPVFKKKIHQLVWWVGGALGVLGFFQYFFYNNLRNIFYLGWDEHMYRLFSTFLDPNFAGAMLVLFSFFFASHILVAAKKKDKKWWLLVCLYIFLVVAIILTFSRTAYIMMLVGSSTMLVLYKKVRWLSALWIIAVTLFLLLSRNFSNENMNLLRTFSSYERLESMQRATTIITQYPIFGVGFGAYRYAQIESGYTKEETPFPSHADASTDNSILFIFATTGVVGLTSYGYLIYRVLQIRKTTNDALVLPVLISSVVALGVGSIFNNLLFYSFIMVWVWILIGLTECK